MPFKINDQVRSVVDSGRIGVVVGLGPVYAGVQYYKVFWGGAIGVQTVAEIDLQEHRPLGKPSEALGAGPIVGYAEFQRLITYHRISRDRPLRNNIYAFNASRTQFFAFQFKPLLKLLDSANGRLLICDEVGLGKTIEAGMILLEERARRDIRTVLVLCPAGLRAKWKLELRRRFDEEFAILDAAAFSAFLDDYERSPERAHVAGILSLEAARSRNLLARIEDVEPVFDLLIVDEAHHLRNFGTRSRRAAAALGGGSGTFVMLTATPVHLGTDNLFSLLNLLDHRDFPDAATAEERFRQNEPIVAAQRLVGGGPQTAENALAQLKVAARSPWVAGNPLLDRVRENLAALAAATDADEARRLVFAAQRDLTELNLLSHIFTRTRKRDVKIAVPVREAHAWVVNLSPQERLFYEAASALLSKERERLGASPVGIRWALNTLQRRMASSIHATVEYYRTHRPFDVADRGDDEGIEENGEDQQPEKGQLDELRRTVRALVDQWPSNSPDSKCERLLALIREQSVSRPGRKLIVFAFFKETLRYLSRRLTAGGIGHVRVDGSVAPEDREALIARFRDEPHCQVMLCSRVGSEGLDFQFCDSLVNYDLPWNPMEVEQRIGRLDRIGQKSPKIHIFNLWTADTIEQRILMRLYERIGIFERSIGSLDAIIGDILEDLDAVLLDPELTPEEQEAEAERIAQVIESGRRNLEELEQKATAFLGVDGFFEREIEGIREGRRYVTGEQLLRFLEDYLRQKAPATRLRYDRQTRKGVIVPDAELRRLAQHHHRAGELVRLIGAGSGGVPFTVDPEVAFEDQSIEFINVLHPLVEIIRESYAEDLASRVSAQRVALRTAKLPPGDYIFVVYRLRMEGVRVLNFLEAVILDQRLQEVCDRETAEALIGEMVELGHDPEDASLKLDADFAASAAKRAEDVFVARVAGIRADFERENAATVDRRIASLRFQLERQLTRRRELLVRQKEEARPERILQLTRGQISKLEGELSRRLAELEVHRHVQVGYEEVAAGILEAVE